MQHGTSILEVLVPADQSVEAVKPRNSGRPRRRRSRRSLLRARWRDLRELLWGWRLSNHENHDESVALPPPSAHHRTRSSARFRSARRHRSHHAHRPWRHSARHVLTGTLIAVGMLTLFWILVSSCESTAQRNHAHTEDVARRQAVTAWVG